VDTLLVAVRVLLSLAAVLGLLWVLHRRLSRGPRAKNAANPVTVVGRQAVGQKAAVVIVDVDGQRFVLGVTEQAVSVLHRREAPGRQSADEFALSLAEATDAAPSAATLTPLSGPALTVSPLGGAAVDGPWAPALRPRRPTAAAPGHSALGRSVLGGSILSPTTWKQTAAALRRSA